METPNNVNGLLTELVMMNIKRDVFDGRIETSKYNAMYASVYKTLSAWSEYRSYRKEDSDDPTLGTIY